jgi:hypothetical protein
LKKAKTAKSELVLKKDAENIKRKQAQRNEMC